MNYNFDNRIVVTLDAGGTNFVFSAIKSGQEIVKPFKINAVTDNPLVFDEEDLIISGGNFHGEPLALALDYLTIDCTLSPARRYHQFLLAALEYRG